MYLFHSLFYFSQSSSIITPLSKDKHPSISSSTASTTTSTPTSSFTTSTLSSSSSTKKIVFESILSSVSPQNTHTNGFFPSINGASHTFACGATNNCVRITEYAISSNYTFNCFEANLPIIFELLNANNTKVLSFGFLPQNAKMITNIQSKSKICRKVKRFFFLYKMDIFNI